MKKKSAIALAVIAVLLCLIGVGIICYNLGAKKAADSGNIEKEAAAESSAALKESGSEEKQESPAASEPQSEASEEEASEAASQEEEKEPAELTAKEEGEIAYPSNSGALAVKGTQLVDQNGNPVQLKGISTHGLAWFPAFVDQNAFREFRQNWNVNVIRLAMYTAENGGYCEGGNKEDLKNIIYRGVQYATDNDMYVIIDWHILHDLDPNKYKDEAIDFFDGMSKKYKDNNNVIYEICNEPNGGTTWASIKSYAEEVIPVIRANDPDAVILVGTPNWSQRVDEAAKDPITDYDNIMYTLHFYAATHKDDLRNTMVQAIKDGLPVFVSEYGICDASGNGGLDKNSAQKWVDVMNENNVSYICWALANKSESAALIKSSVSKTSGFTDSDLSPSGKWLYNMLTGKEAVSSDGGNGGSAQNNNQSQPAEDVQEFQSGGLECTISLGSQWETDGKQFYQFNLSVANTGDNKLKSWAIDIHFSDNVELESGWGGNYTVNGKTLHVTNVDYNGTIEGGATLGDLGFIIKSSKGLEITK